MKENKKSVDTNVDKVTTREKQVQWLNTTYFTFVISNPFYDIISIVKLFDFAGPEGLDIIQLLMTKLQTDRNSLLINKIKTNKTQVYQGE